jgi:hypothetical protein
MRYAWIAVCALAVLVGCASDEEPRPLTAAVSMDAASEPPPRAVVRGCAGRIEASTPRRRDDTVVGPFRFNVRGYSRPRAWRQIVKAGQWIKSPAKLRAGAEVTLEVPEEQRSWMSLAYALPRPEVAAVTLRACRHRPTPAARRRECKWTAYTACRSGPTYFSGGFVIDYDEAPQQGRCAELIVWVEGEEEPRRIRLLHVEPGECASASSA